MRNINIFSISSAKSAKTALAIKIIFLMLCGLLSCQSAQEPVSPDARLKVTATTFPLFDFARNIGGDKATVKMLLPPASNAHHYELKPSDIARVSKTDIFLFTSFDLEYWAYKIIKAAGKTNMTAVETGQGAMLLPLDEFHRQEIGHTANKEKSEPEHSSQYDPHIWLDFNNARLMIDNISRAFMTKDVKNSEYYKKNAEAYKLKLAQLDQKYQTELTHCKNKTILHAGHWAFAYLANRHHLQYLSAYNMSADAEPSPQKITLLINQVKKQNLPYIYYEDLVEPKLARTIAAETGAGLLKLHNGHDISKKDFQSGETFLTLMERNLVNFKKGMQCQ